MTKTGKIKAFVMSLALAAAVAIPVAYAQTTEEGPKAKRDRGGRFERHGGRGGMRGGMMGFRNLDLTDEQKAQIKQIRENHRQAMTPIMEQIRQKRQEIRQASQDGSFNESLVAQKLAEIAPLEAKMMAERARIHQETMSVLTAEQKAKLEEQRQQRHNRFKERRERRQSAT
jgi:protein CpxP